MLAKLKELGGLRIAILAFVIAFMGSVFYFFASQEEVLLAVVILAIAFHNRNNAANLYSAIAQRQWWRLFKKEGN